MGLVLALFSVALVLLSIGGVFQPSRLIGLVDILASGKLGLWSAIVVRFIFALLLWMNSQASNAPTSFKVLSVLLVLSAISHLIVGRDRLRSFRQILSSWPLWAIRVPCFFGVAMGVYVLWALSPVIGVAS